MVLIGFLNINKPKGISSHDVVYKVRRRLRQLNILGLKVGHTGTLDPFARGVLVVAIGRATKLTRILQDKKKSYIAKLELGIQTDTDDITGKIIKQAKIFGLQQSVIENVLQNYTGKIIQEPPIYSAIHVDGKRLYKYARENEKVNIPKREVFISKLDLLQYKKDEYINIFVECSAGTYIRALGRDIGIDLGSCATLDDLKRIKVAGFDILYSYELSDIEDFSAEEFAANIIKIEDVFCDASEIEILDKEIFDVKNGNLKFLKNIEANKIIKLIYKNKLLALVKKNSETGKIKFILALF